MKRLILPLLAASLAVGLFAGTGSEVGSATVKAGAEFATINLWIKSQCYGTPDEALADNDKTTAEVLNILVKYQKADSKVDKIYHEGGVTSEYQYYVSGEDKTLCQNTFQKVSKVTLVTENIKDFGQTFAAIQTEALAKFVVRNSNTNSSTATTFVTVGQPTADVCTEKRTAMQKEALALATQDAHARFWSCAKQCGVDAKTIKVVGINPPTSESFGGFEKSAAFSSAPGAGPGINFHDISESATVKVSYTFEDSDFASCVMLCH